MRSEDKERQSPPRIVADVLARAQHLVDSRPAGPYETQWCSEAYFVGVATALATVWLAREITAV